MTNTEVKEAIEKGIRAGLVAAGLEKPHEPNQRRLNEVIQLSGGATISLGEAGEFGLTIGETPTAAQLREVERAMNEQNVKIFERLEHSRKFAEIAVRGRRR
jgi:hypothetical protein